MKLLFLFICSLLATTFNIVNSHGCLGPHEVFHLPSRNGPPMVEHHSNGIRNRAVGPVCATNGKNYVLFEDESLLDEYNYAKLSPGEYRFMKTTAAHCYDVCKYIKCPSTNAPICVSAQNSQLRETMNNECELERRFCLTQIQLVILYDGPCVSSCPSSCSKNYRPICVQSNSQNVTFANICKLKCFIHESKQKWYIIHEGPCNTHTYVYKERNQEETLAIGKARSYVQLYTPPPRRVYNEAPLITIPRAKPKYGSLQTPSSSSLWKYSSDEWWALLLDALKSSSSTEVTRKWGSSEKYVKMTTTTHAPTTYKTETEFPVEDRIKNLLVSFLDSFEKQNPGKLIRNLIGNITSFKPEVEMKSTRSSNQNYVKTTTTTHAPTGTTYNIEPEFPFDDRIKNLLEYFLDSFEKKNPAILIRNLIRNNTSFKPEIENVLKPLLNFITEFLHDGKKEPANFGTTNEYIIPSTPSSIEPHNCCHLIELIVNIIRLKGLELSNYETETDSVEVSDTTATTPNIDATSRATTALPSTTDSLDCCSWNDFEKMVKPVLHLIKRGIRKGRLFHPRVFRRLGKRLGSFRRRLRAIEDNRSPETTTTTLSVVA